MKSIKIVAVAVIALCILSIAYLAYTTLSGLPKSTPSPPTRLSETPKPAESQLPAPSITTAAQPDQEEASDTGIHLFGTVIDAETNTPVSGATLTGVMSGDQSRDTVEHTTTTDASGAFTLAVSGNGSGALHCWGLGYMPARQDFSGLQGASIRLDFLLRPGSSVAGAITDKAGGAPVENVRVMLLGAQKNVFDLMQQGRRNSEVPSTDTTDPDGAYRIEGVPPGSYRVVLDSRDAGYLFAPEEAITLDIESATDYDHVDFALEYGAVISGTVTDASGAPVTKAHVLVMPMQMIQSAIRGLNTFDPSAFGPRRATTGENGAYEITGVEYDTELRVVADSIAFATARSEPLTLTRNAPTARVDFTLTAGSAVSGTARYPDGAPASQVRLILFPGSGEGWSNFMGPRSAQTEADGSFRLANLPAGSYLLRPEREFGLQRTTSGSGPVSVEVDGRMDVTGLDIVVQREAEPPTDTIAGVVIDPTGAPVPEVRVEAKRTDNPRETAGMLTTTDGSFELAGLRGLAYDISVDDEAGIARESAVAVGTQITIQLAMPGVVGGLVVDARGEAVQGASVELKDLGGSGPAPTMESIMRGLFSGAAEGRPTDPYGHFEFRKVAPGDYEVAVESASQGTACSEPFTIDPGTEVTDLYLVLDAGVTFSGIVVGAGGEPIRGAQVQLVPSGEDPTTDMISQFLPAAMLKTTGSTTSTETGEFTMSNVPPGTYKLVATHRDYAKTTIPNVQVYKGRDVAGYRVTMGQGGNARGTYLIDGKPQPGAMIMVVGASGFEMVQTDSQGMFDVRGLPSGTYMLNAFDPARIASNGQGIQFRPQIVDVVDGQAVNVDLGGSAGVSVSGVVSGEPGTLTVVALRKPGGPSLEDLDLTNVNNLIESMRYLAGQSVIGPDGSFRVDGVEPGDYVLEVYSMNFDERNPNIMALINMPRTPAFRQTITVGEQPPDLNIVLGP